jgi:hypothetical protein
MPALQHGLEKQMAASSIAMTASSLKGKHGSYWLNGYEWLPA